MTVEVLAPATQHGDDADLGAQMAEIDCDHAKRRGHRLERDL